MYGSGVHDARGAGAVGECHGPQSWVEGPDDGPRTTEAHRFDIGCAKSQRLDVDHHCVHPRDLIDASFRPERVDEVLTKRHVGACYRDVEVVTLHDERGEGLEVAPGIAHVPVERENQVVRVTPSLCVSLTDQRTDGRFRQRLVGPRSRRLRLASVGSSGPRPVSG